MVKSHLLRHSAHALLTFLLPPKYKWMNSYILMSGPMFFVFCFFSYKLYALILTWERKLSSPRGLICVCPCCIGYFILIFLHVPAIRDEGVSKGDFTLSLLKSGRIVPHVEKLAKVGVSWGFLSILFWGDKPRKARGHWLLAFLRCGTRREEESHAFLGGACFFHCRGVHEVKADF